MTEKLLQVKNLVVQYGGVFALNGASLDIDEGEIVAVMGPNGAGKSTVLKAIFGLAPISAGEICWHEQPVNPAPHLMAARGIAFVPQGRRVLGNLTIKENLQIGGFAVSDKEELKRRIEEVEKIFPLLKNKQREKAGSLSGGQQQMLALARGLMVDPKVLLLDEPTLGLSPKVIKEVFEKIVEINQRHGTAIMIVEHNIKSVLAMAARAYFLHYGKVVYSGAADSINQTDLSSLVLAD